MLYLVFLGRELGLDLVYFLVRDPERLGEHDVGQLTGSTEERHGDEANINRAIEDEDELHAAQRVQAPRRVVDAGA